MKCPKCSTSKTLVVSSREPVTEDYVNRRRKCGACAYRFTTYEQIETPENDSKVTRDKHIVRAIRKIFYHYTEERRR